jgi:hypothetical protein
MNNVRSIIIAVPAYKPYAALTESEHLAWLQFTQVYAAYDFCLICPDSLLVEPYQASRPAVCIRAERFANSFFTGTASYNKLLLTLDFYQRFSAYEYLLICQLDVFVFRDALPEWMSKGYSYVGPPWFRGFEPPLDDAQLWHVGNGGFSLRRVAHAIRVLTTDQPIFSWPTLLRGCFSAGLLPGLKQVPATLRRGLLANSTHHSRNDYPSQEDVFWSVICADRFAWYTVPTPQEALDFGFDYHPTLMLELNSGQLPMGFHAWDRHRNEFWTELFRQAGHSLLPREILGSTGSLSQ